MALRRYSGTAGTLYSNRRLRISSLQNHSVGNHADICANAAKFNFSWRHAIQLVTKPSRQIQTSERRLVQRVFFGCVIRQLINNLPSVAAFYTMFYRKKFPLLSIQVVLTMSIPCEKYRQAALFVAFNFFSLYFQ